MCDLLHRGNCIGIDYRFPFMELLNLLLNLPNYVLSRIMGWLTGANRNHLICHVGPAGPALEPLDGMGIEIHSLA